MSIGRNAAIAWALLVAAGLLEIVWPVALKQADGFTRLRPSVLGVTAAAASLYLLTIALRSLPVGTAYAAWVGIGAIGVAAVGILVFGDQASPLRLVFLALILAGVIGLRIIEG